MTEETIRLLHAANSCRKAQVKYERFKSKDNLKDCIALEYKLDQIINELQAPSQPDKQQASLFDK